MAPCRFRNMSYRSRLKDTISTADSGTTPTFVSCTRTPCLQDNVQIAIELYRCPLAVTHHEMSLRRKRLPLVVYPVDRSTTVYIEDRSTRAAVRKRLDNMRLEGLEATEQTNCKSRPP